MIFPCASESESDAEPIEASGRRKVIAVIGIDRYRGWPRLGCAVGDARGALSLFRRLGFEELTEPLFDEQATGSAIRALVTDELQSLGANDSLVLFYAGHGGTRVQRFGDQELRTGYLIPSDAANVRDKVATWIDLEGWLRQVSLLPARHILVILDACYSGVALAPLIRWRDVQLGPDMPIESLAARRSRRIITSALDDQVALDSGPVHGHSLFTGCLIEALTGGIVRGGRRATTGSEIGLYVQRRVATYPGARQTPDFGAFDLDDRGEMLIPFLPDDHGDVDLSRPGLSSTGDRPPLRLTAGTGPPAGGARPRGPAECRGLSGAELAEIREVLLDAFDKAELDRWLSDHLDYNRGVEVGEGSLRHIMDLVLRHFVRRGALAQLISEAARARPLKANVQEIYSKYVAPRTPDPRGDPCS